MDIDDIFETETMDENSIERVMEWDPVSHTFVEVSDAAELDYLQYLNDEMDNQLNAEHNYNDYLFYFMGFLHGVL